jgi:glycosyltransferase involved in cell wall biosynthesis
MIHSFPGLPFTYAWSAPAGVYQAMNAALALAKEDYVYFLNAGDRFASSTVVRQMTEALDVGQPAWAFGGVDFLAADGSHLSQTAWSYAEERRRLFARGHFPAHQGIVVRTECLRGQGGFDPTYTVAADYLSVLKLARESNPLELAFVVAVFPVGGLSSQRWQLGLQEFHRARREVFRPTGRAAIAEGAHTARTWLATSAYRTLWAPGRPLSAPVARFRSGASG